ncbi:uncharacterized protein LOC122516932 [Polistes fuscatus]|uniref:uncharacterized protein LOC122516932 n=1 Tax=Polistes fuscatus TaxID=30207 RepID=UPI001CAA2FA5|nr:uncharacterized protein LOC122516932 [Polistes fuscatus]
MKHCKQLPCSVSPREAIKMGARSAPQIFLRLTSKSFYNISRSSSIRTKNILSFLSFTVQKRRANLWPDLSRSISMATTQRFIFDRSEFITLNQMPRSRRRHRSRSHSRTRSHSATSPQYEHKRRRIDYDSPQSKGTYR